MFYAGMTSNKKDEEKIEYTQGPAWSLVISFWLNLIHEQFSRPEIYDEEKVNCALKLTFKLMAPTFRVCNWIMSIAWISDHFYAWKFHLLIEWKFSSDYLDHNIVVGSIKLYDYRNGEKKGYKQANCKLSLRMSRHFMAERFEIKWWVC